MRRPIDRNDPTATAAHFDDLGRAADRAELFRMAEILDQLNDQRRAEQEAEQ